MFSLVHEALGKCEASLMVVVRGRVGYICVRIGLPTSAAWGLKSCAEMSWTCVQSFITIGLCGLENGAKAFLHMRVQVEAGVNPEMLLLRKLAQMLRFGCGLFFCFRTS